MSEHAHTPEPEILTREDTENGRWDVEHVAPRRGLPVTNIVDRIMRAPGDDTEMSRVIRAHEMMHAKVSPAHDMDAWVERKIASVEALKACEELRVNLLCQKAGFDVKQHLSDDGETADGERIAATNDWHGAVMMAMATAGTASSKKFLTGIRRHNRKWGKILKDITKRAEKHMEIAYQQRTLASTDVYREMQPRGFFHTEQLAEWVDRIAAQSPPKPDPEPDKGDDEADKDEGNGDGTEGGREHSNIGSSGAHVYEKFEERLKGITLDRHKGPLPRWEELRVEQAVLSVHAPGSIGKKRIPADTGRHPRRIHRLLTDPKRRIFDRTIRGRGGVVVIDCSGSMSLSQEEIKEILIHAPGATVLGYSDLGDEGTNGWILAHKGKMVSEAGMPDMGSGNGVDLPAVEWGVKARQRPNSPVIWITDGGVCGKDSGFADLLAVQCVNYCLKNNVYVAEHVQQGVEMLKAVARGERPRDRWPSMLTYAYHHKMGQNLRNVR
jgi:hypothetical protein